MKTKFFTKVAGDFFKARLQGFENSEFLYRHNWLDSLGTHCNADEYFKDISYNIHLTSKYFKVKQIIDLYTVIDTCYYHDDMEYVPILLKICEQRIKNAYDGAEYLLQIWEKKTWSKIYQIPLKRNIQILILFDSINEYHLVLGTQKTLHFCWIQDKLFECLKQRKDIDARNLVFEEYKSSLKIQAILNENNPDEKGFYLQKVSFIVVFETEQNKLDFNLIELNQEEPKNKDHKIFLKFKQQRDVFLREYEYIKDPIVKCCFRYSHGKLFGVALRESGGFDLYSNMIHKDSIENPEDFVSDIGMSITTFFFQMKDSSFQELRHQDQPIISFDQAEEMNERFFTLQRVPNKIAQNFVTLFSGFKIIQNDENTLCIVSHNQFVSVYDILDKRWIHHIEFHSEVRSLFFQEEENTGETFLCVLLTSNDVYCNIERFFQSQNRISIDERNHQIKQKIDKVVEIGEPGKRGNIFFIMYNEKQIFYIFQQKLLQEEGFQGSEMHISRLQLTDNNYDQFYNSQPIIMRNDRKLSVYRLGRHGEGKYLEQILELDNYDYQSFGFHTAFSYDLKDHVVLFSDDDAYVYDIKEKGIRHYQEKVFCVGLLIFNKEINYAVCKETSISTSHGLKIIQMDQLVEKSTLKMTLLKQIDIGALGDIILEGNTERMAFISSVTDVILHPYLHTNTNKFIGLRSQEDYICHKVLDHKLIALKNNGDLVTWNIFNGKQIKPVIKTDHKYDDKYDILYKQKQRILMFSKDDEQDCKDEDYFTEEQLNVNIKNDQIPLIKVTPFSYKRWKMIEIIDQNKVIVALDFIFPKFAYQRMFINDKMNGMIVILEYNRVFYYKKVIEHLVLTKDQPFMKWQFVKQISDFPFNLLDSDATTLDSFTNDFELYIRFSKKDNQFEIKFLESGECYRVIPKDIMSTGVDMECNEVMNRFKWLDSSRFLIVNPEGLEKIVNIDKEFQEEAFNYRPLFNELSEGSEEWRYYSYYNKRSDLGDDILGRLKRIYQKYKSSYFLFKLYDDPIKMYEQLITIDEHDFSKFEHCFTFLHWSLLDQLIKKSIKFKDIQEPVLEQMLYNILPGGNMIFHKLHKSQNKITKVFKICHPEDQIKYHVPYLPNFFEQSPLDLSLALGQKDYKSIFSILQYLKLYPLDHHSRTIRRSYHIIIKQQIPEFLDYLDSRLQQTKQLEDLNKGSLDKEMIAASIWSSEDYIKSQMLGDDDSGAAIKLEILDVPYVYHYLDEQFVPVFKQLAEAKNFSYFDNKAIKAIIDFNYPLVRKLIIYLLILPFCIFHITFVVYMNVVYEYRIYDDNYYKANIVLAIVQLVFSLYFLFNEAKQIMNLKVQYLTSVWNYIDLIAPAGVIILHGFQFAEFNEIEINIHLNRSVIAISTFFMWLKFLYILRVFKQTGYLIRMIFEVIYDMGIFLFVLLITIAAFGDSFLRISLGNEEENQFTTSFVPAILFTYSMILGGYDTEAFGEVAQPLVWIFWVLCTLLVMIVMLNLLIAIISGTYERVIDNQEQAAYQEMASLISENYFLIPKKLRKEYASQNQYILLGTNLEKIKDERDAVQKQFDTVYSKIEEIKYKMNEQILIQEQKEQALMKQQRKENEILQNKLGQLKVFLLKSSPPEQIKVSCHKHELQKFTNYQVQERYNFRTYRSFICNAKYFDGCKSSNKDENRKDPKENLYYCKTCQTTQCEKCFRAYQDSHEHEMQKYKFENLKLEHNVQSWKCACFNFKKCKGRYQSNDQYETQYHDPLCYFDLCEDCMKQFKI